VASIYHRAIVWQGSATVQIYTGAGLLFGMQLGTDGTNDPTITIYDNTAASGTELVPTAAYEADYKGLNGFTCAYGKQFDTGLHIEITCAGTVEVAVDYRKL
jgi:hypothetical protein